jgi:hypothetical protein
VLGVSRVANRSLAVQVVKVGAWLQADALVPDGLVVVLDQLRIGPGLVGRVHGLHDGSAQPGLHHGISLGDGDLAPLFELDDHGNLALGVVPPGEDEIHTLARHRDDELDGHPGVGRDLGCPQHTGHELHGVAPGRDLAFRGAPAQPSLVLHSDTLVNAVVVNVRDELAAGGGVDDQDSPSSLSENVVYLRAFPRACCTGYLRSFDSIFAAAAARRSISRRSARRTR